MAKEMRVKFVKTVEVASYYVLYTLVGVANLYCICQFTLITHAK
jgi:uncharacterized membrane protein YuzA (DUF378 family)